MTHRRLRDGGDQGTTLVELMMAGLITAVIGLLFIVWVSAVAQVELFQRQDQETLDSLRLAKARLVTELRFAEAIDSGTDADTLVFWVDADDDGIRDSGETITWDIGTGGDLVRSTDDGTSLTLASGLDTSASSFVLGADTITLQWAAEVDAARGPQPRSIRTEVALRRTSVTSSTSTTTTSTTTTVPTAQPTFRVTTYELHDDAAGFTATSYTLQLNQDLQADYFVMVKGGAGDGSSSGGRGPDENFMRVDADPFGTGDLGTTANLDELGLKRDNSTGTWQGTVTVVETLRDQTASGFTLVDVAKVEMEDDDESETVTVAAWSDSAQVAVYGGMRGGGVVAGAKQTDRHPTAYARIWPSGSDTVNLARDLPSNKKGDATFTVYVVEWGSEWTIQHVNVAGSAGGNGMDATGDYVTAAISPVVRANTWVTGFGTSSDNGVGDGWSGRAVTLGDGVGQIATESLVAVGGEYSDSIDAEVYTHTHPGLAVDYVFVGDGTISSTAVQGTVSVDAAVDPGGETYDNSSSTLRWTQGTRFAQMWNSQNGTDNSFPRPFLWARPTASTQVQWLRSRSGQQAAAWVSTIDLGNLTS
ncbi:MAG: type II secretion system protein J [Acidimicrobiia bacterium]